MFRGRIIHTASGVAFGGKGYISFNKTTLHKYYTKQISDVYTNVNGNGNVTVNVTINVTVNGNYYR